MRVPGWQSSCGVRFEGDEGWVQTDDSGDVQVHPLALRSQRALTTEEWKRPVAHPRNFLDCIKTRARPIADVETARCTHVACHASNIAVELGRKMRWDAIKGEFIGDEEANRMRSRAMRAPWRV